MLVIRRLAVAFAVATAVLVTLGVGGCVYLAYTIDISGPPGDQGRRFLTMTSACNEDLFIFSSGSEAGAHRGYIEYVNPRRESTSLGLGEQYSVSLFREDKRSFVAVGTDPEGPSSIIEVPVEYFSLPRAVVTLQSDCRSLSAVSIEGE